MKATRNHNQLNTSFVCTYLAEALTAREREIMVHSKLWYITYETHAQYIQMGYYLYTGAINEWNKRQDAEEPTRQKLGVTHIRREFVVECHGRICIAHSCLTACTTATNPAFPLLLW